MIKSSNISLIVNGALLSLNDPSIGFGNQGITFAVDGLSTTVELSDTSTQSIVAGDAIKIGVSLDGDDYTYLGEAYTVDSLPSGGFKLRLK